MNLRRLRIERLPGIRSPYEISSEGPGFHVVFGPNAIGKSSICRAVEGLFWEDRGSSHHTSTDADFEIDGDVWRVEREAARVRWKLDGEVRQSPNLPPSHHRNCFFLRLPDLIDPSSKGTQDVAAEIRRQFAGGFDLKEIAENTFGEVGPRYGNKDSTAFLAATKKVEGAENEQINLQRWADQLGARENDLTKVEEKLDRKSAVERALELADRLESLRTVTEELSALPARLVNLVGKEDERLEKLKNHKKELEREKDRLAGEIAETERVREETGLAEVIDERLIDEWQSNVDKLARFERDLDTEKNNLKGAQVKLEAALLAIGEGDIAKIEFGQKERKNLRKFFKNSEDLRTKKKVIDERMRLLKDIDQLGLGEDDLDRMRDAVKALRSWLIAPAQGTLSPPLKARRLWTLTSLLLVVAGGVLGFVVDIRLAALAAFGIGIGVPNIFLLFSRQPSNKQTEARERYAKTGFDEPQTWETNSVEERLDQLDREVATLAAQLQRKRDRDVEYQKLRTELTGLESDQTKIDEDRERLLNLIKFDDVSSDAELFDIVTTLDRIAVAREEEQAFTGKVQALEDKCAKLLSELSNVFGEYDELPPADADAAKATLRRLASRNAKLKEANTNERHANGQLDQVKRNLSRNSQDIARIFSGAGLDAGDEHGLKARLRLLPGYMGKASDRQTLESQIAADRQALEKIGESELVDRDKAYLEKLFSSLNDETQQAQDLRDKIAENNAAVKQARESHQLQNLINNRENIRMQLQACREETLLAKAGQFLLDHVEKEYEKTQMPRVFERARSLFSSFTHHSYELDLGSGELIARDLKSNDEQTLEKLSDGTRAQLLLAARMAFAEEIERGRTLPLFLDEALGQSDPARYRIIVQSLGQIVKDEGRQIFYLTSDPLDFKRIQNALEEGAFLPAIGIDLGKIRTQVASLSDDPEVLQVDPRPSVLAPEVMTPEEYGVRLGVPPLDPAWGASDQHLFYLLRDHLGMLHDLLQMGVERAGQWQSVARNPLDKRLTVHKISPEELSLRVQLMDTFCKLWAQGRGQPIDREAIHASDVISDRYLDGLATIAEEISGDAEAFLAILHEHKDPRLKGLRMNIVEGLEQHLRNHNYLDEQPVLEEGELRLKALTSPAANALPDRIADTLLNAWWQLAQYRRPTY